MKSTHHEARTWTSQWNTGQSESGPNSVANQKTNTYRNPEAFQLFWRLFSLQHLPNKRRGRNRVGQMLGEAVVLGTCSFEAGVWEWGDMSFSRHALKHDPCFGVMSHWIFFST